MNPLTSLTAIDDLLADFNYVRNQITSQDLSVSQNLQRHLTKMLILSCASHYENAITSAIKAYSLKHSTKYRSHPHGFDVISDRSFFQMFDFGREKLNGTKAFLAPFKYFGTAFKESFIADVMGNANYERDMKAFQELCSIRNSLAHNDLITYNDASSKSFDDIMLLHTNAKRFVDLLISKLA